MRILSDSLRGAARGLRILLAGCDWKTEGDLGDILSEATRMAEAGRLSPSLDPRRFKLDEVADAYRLIAEGKARGKLSIDIEEGEGS